MAQHDYVIDNSTGANVRADINNALLAISSNNSGSSAPSTTYALQTFANTTDSMLQLRNAANNAFVNLRKFDGSLPLPDGTNSAPSLFFDDDTDTGIYSSAANTFNITAGGTERLELGGTTIFNEDGADVDFRIEGNNEVNLFYLDAGNDKIGIGSNAPSARLSVLDDTAFTAFASAVPNSTDCMLQVSSNPSSEAVNRHATIQFGVNGGTHNRVASISSVAESASNRKMGLVFCTDSGSNRNERMRLDGDGQLGLGTSSPNTKLDVRDSNSTGISSRSTNTQTTNTNKGLKVRNNSDTDTFSVSYKGQGYFAGNVGIGTTSPDAILTLDGSSNPTISIKAGGTKRATLTADTGSSKTVLSSYDGFPLEFSSSAGGGNNTVMTLLNNGNVGIGTDNPQGSMHLKSMSGVLSVDSYPQLTIETSATDGGAHKGGGILFLNHNGSGGTFGGSIQCLKENATVGNTANYIRFSTRPAAGSVIERMRIDSDGNLLIGTSSQTVDTSNFGINLGQIGTANIFRNTTGGFNVFQTGGNEGAFQVRGDGDAFNTNNSYGQISDETLKQDIVDATSQWNDIKFIKVRKFRFKDNPTGVLQIGVVAQEIEKVSAGLVQTDDEGIKSVKYSVLYMKAVKCLQEAIAKIEVLETKVAALEAA